MLPDELKSFLKATIDNNSALYLLYIIAEEPEDQLWNKHEQRWEQTYSHKDKIRE
jgi:hypothetical protein